MAAKQPQPAQPSYGSHGAPLRRRLQRERSGVLEMPRNALDNPLDDLNDLTDPAPTLPQIPSIPRLRVAQTTSPSDAPRDAPAPPSLDSHTLRIAADWSAYVLARDWMHDDRLAGVSLTARMRIFTHLGRLYLPVTEAAQQ